MGDRGQASVEFLMVIGVGMLLLLPATILFLQYSQSSSDDLKFGQLVRMGNEMVNNAERVYYYSDPSKIEIDVVMPPDMVNLTIDSDWASRVNLISFYIKSKGTVQPITFFSRINVNATVEARDLTPGRKRVVLEVKRDGSTGLPYSGQPYVSIDFI